MEDQTPPLTSPQNPKTYKLTASSISYIKTAATITTLFFKPCPTTAPIHVLNDVSFTAFPSQILAIVGPSGAGKSTLLDILAARTYLSSGTLLLNSHPIKRSYYRKLMAYVPQHDACLPLLTVYETFEFAARLLNPKAPDISFLVNNLLVELGLTHLANTRMAYGLSGGERRRVSIGLSLLSDPSILILDEPTSGLDSSSAYKVLQTLRLTADSRHCTVVLSIHQPSFKILSIIDRILLLSKGTVLHHGTLSSLQAFLLFKGFTVPPQLNSLEYAMEILSQLQVNRSSVSEDQTPSPSPSLPNNSPISPDTSTRKQITHKSTRLHEILTLYQRFWKIIYRTKQLLLTNTLQALIVGLVLGTIFINIGLDKKGIEKRMGLFAFTLTFLLSSTTETLPIFINERPILLRETSSGVYRLSSYLIANTLVFLPYLLVIAIIYSLSVYFLVGLCGKWQAFSYFILVIWVIVLMANSFVLCLSSIAPNYISGTSLLTILLATFFLFSGYFVSTEKLPKYWLFMHYSSMYKYALDALLINEYSCLATRCFIWYDENKTCMITGGDVLANRGLLPKHRWSDVYILIGFFVFFRVLWLLIMMRRLSRSKK